MRPQTIPRRGEFRSATSPRLRGYRTENDPHSPCTHLGEAEYGNQVWRADICRFDDGVNLEWSQGLDFLVGQGQIVFGECGA
jgi:hypothetical protein